METNDNKSKVGQVTDSQEVHSVHSDSNDEAGNHVGKHPDDAVGDDRSTMAGIPLNSTQNKVLPKKDDGQTGTPTPGTL